MLKDFKQLSDLDFHNVSEWPVAVRWAAVVLTFIIILILGYQLDTKSTLNTLFADRAIEQNLKMQYKGTVGRLMNVQNNEVQIDQMKKIFAKVLDDLPRNFDIAALLNGISRVGKNNGLIFKSLKPAAEKRFEFYAVVPITVVVVGDYHQLAKFVSDVANLEQPLQFTNLNIVPEKSNKDKKKYVEMNNANLLELDLTAEVYRYTRSDEVHNDKA